MSVIDELKAKQAQINGLLRLLEDPASAQFIDPAKVAAFIGPDKSPLCKSVLLPEPSAASKPQRTRRVVANRGVRASILRLLLTGPCSMRAISDVIGAKYDRRAITRTLWQLVEEGLAKQDQDGYAILPAAIQQAQFLLNNPNLKTIAHKALLKNA